MENKRWNFKIPGSPDGKGMAVDTSEIKTVYDLLDRLRSEQPQAPQKGQHAGLKSKPKAAVIPFVSRMLDKRRHPSA